MTDKKYSAAIFDLDGTIIDSSRDIVTATNKTIVNLGGNALDEEDILHCVGTGVSTLIRETLQKGGVLHREDEAMAYMTEAYLEHCLDYTHVYEGIRDVLTFLNGKKIPVALLTNKPHRYLEKILTGLNLDSYFAYALGADNGFASKPELTTTQHVLNELQVEAGQALMVGDSMTDFMTAQNAGMGAALYLKGFGLREKLMEQKDNAFLYEDPLELIALFSSKQ